MKLFKLVSQVKLILGSLNQFVLKKEDRSNQETDLADYFFKVCQAFRWGCIIIISITSVRRRSTCITMIFES